MFGALGLNNKYSFNAKTLVSTSIVATSDIKELTQDRLDNALALQRDLNLKSNTAKLSLNTYLNYKLNERLNTRTGINLNSLFYNFNLNGTENETPGTFVNYANESGNSCHVQVYSESKYRFSDALSFNGGIQAEYFLLTKSFTVDPRISMNWDFSVNQSLSFGYGKHSQLEDLNIYFIKGQVNGQKQYLNKDLGFSQAHHFVLGYNHRFNENMRLKLEPYVQYLYNIPGIADSSFSMINFRQDLSFQSKLEIGRAHV